MSYVYLIFIVHVKNVYIIVCFVQCVILLQDFLQTYLRSVLF